MYNVPSWLLRATLLSAIVSSAAGAMGQTSVAPAPGNREDRLEWFRDLGFGLFIHWSVDSQLGVVISHSLVGASPDYTRRFFTELPKTFDPQHFDPGEWARLARIAGVRYLLFTTKHHSGFTMFDSSTTPFSITNTPFHRDITKEIFEAFRKQGIAPGIYYSPDDFWWLYEHHKPINRLVPEVQPGNNPALLAYDKTQLTELLTKYGPVDLAYFDGEAKDLRDLAWKLQPDIVVTRGALVTPELNVPETPLPNAWEASITMGTAWQYQPDNEVYKSGHELIRLLFQTRAKGGNLLLNIGPMPNGELAIEQENRLREIGLWMFVNSESIYNVRPWIITHEGCVWFTRNKNDGSLYAIVDSDAWPRGTWREFVLHSVKTTSRTNIGVLGQDDQTVEYKPELHPRSTFSNQADGLHIRVMRAQRLQDNSAWPNAVVIKLTNISAALQPPRIATTSAERPQGHGTTILNGTLLDMGDAQSLQVGFEYQALGRDDTNVQTEPWIPTRTITMNKPGIYSIDLPDLPFGTYRYHAIVHHPLIDLYGADETIK